MWKSATNQALRASTAVLLLATLAAAQTSTQSPWWAAVGGSIGGPDSAIGFVNDGDRRYILGALGNPATGNTDYNEFTWSDGVTARRLAYDGPFFAAKITGEDSLLWVKSPRVCYQQLDVTQGKTCQKYDDPYFMDTVSNVLGTGVKPGEVPVSLVTYTSAGTGANQQYVFQKLDWAWKFVVRADSARVKKTGVADTTTSGNNVYQFQNAPGTLTHISNAATKDRFYALFQYTGDVRFGKIQHGRIKTTTRLLAQDTYIQTSTVDRYDVGYGVALASTVTANTWLPTVTARNGYFLMSIDLSTGDLISVQPIWGQVGRDWTATGIVASSYDNAVYFAGTITGRLFFGTQQKFAETSNIINSYGSGTMVETDKDPLLTAVSVTTPDYVARRFMLRVDKDGAVSNSNMLKISTDLAATVTTYVRSNGNWQAATCAEDSTAVYLGGFWTSPGDNQATTSTPTKLYLGGSTDYFTTQTGTTPALPPAGIKVSAPIYDLQDSFIAKYEGSTLSSGPSWVAQMTGDADAPTVVSLAASEGKVFAIGTFRNITTVKTGTFYGKSATGSGDMYVLALNGDGSYSDGATIQSTAGPNIVGFGANSNRVYIYGTFNAEVNFDYNDKTIAGLTIQPRSTAADYFLATFGSNKAPLPSSEGSASDEDNSWKMKLGVGIGVGVGVPVLICCIVLIFFMLKKKKGGDEGKVLPA